MVWNKSVPYLTISFILGAVCVTTILIILAEISISAKAPAYTENPCLHIPNGLFTANPKGCEYFFYCHNGQALEAFCPGDFWFDEDSQVCDDPRNVDCRFDEPDPETAPIGEEIVCPIVDTKDISFMSSKVSCSTYYICYHGKPIRQECIKDLHWNGLKKKCDYPHNVNCRVCVYIDIL